MPEGPEVWREARAIAAVLEHAPLTRAEVHWKPLAAIAPVIAGATIASIKPRGKAMTLAFSNGHSLVTHNQLYGEWVVASKTPLDHRKALRLLFETPRGAAMLYSATDIDWLPTPKVESHPYIAKLGPDALDATSTIETIRARLASKRFRNRSLASLLLDQSFVAGLGNYLRSDILFLAGVRATHRPADCTDIELDALAEAIITLPRQSFATNGITNDMGLAADLARDGYDFEARRHWVFDRAGKACYVCATPIRHVIGAGRNVFFCPRCQRS